MSLGGYQRMLQRTLRLMERTLMEERTERLRAVNSQAQALRPATSAR